MPLAPRRALAALAAVMLLPLAAGAEQQDVKGAADHALFPRPPGYVVWSYAAPELDQEKFRDGKGGRETVEGKVVRIRYTIRPADKARAMSDLALVRRHRDVIRAQGGVVLVESRFELSGRFERDGNEVWVAVLTNDQGAEYDLIVAERPAPPRPVAPSASAPGAAGGAPGVAVAPPPGAVAAPGSLSAPVAGARPVAPDLTPAVDSVLPVRARHGKTVVLGGKNLKHVNAVRFVDAGGQPWPAPTWAYESSGGRLRVIVPPIPHTQYRLEVVSGWGTARGATPVQLYQLPLNEPPDMKARTQRALRSVVALLETKGQISGAVAGEMRRKIDVSGFHDAAEGISAIQDLALAEAEAAVGGPVSQDVVLLSFLTGRPLVEVAMSWRHCHSMQYGVGSSSDVIRYGIGPPQNEGSVLGPCAGRDRRWHSHVTPASVGNVGAIASAIRSGTRPSAIPEHLHTEVGFRTGRVYYAPIDDDGWYTDALNFGFGAYDFVSDHWATVIAGVKIVLIMYVAEIGCAVATLTTAGLGCGPILVWAGVAIAKQVAVILVAEGIVEVPGIPKDTLVAAISAIPEP
jgi:hypothetical protein